MSHTTKTTTCKTPKYRIEITTEELARFKRLQMQSFETNGILVFDKNTGSLVKTKERASEEMESCALGGCQVNFHTHPPDYTNLYPDHPSETDMQYCLNSIGLLGEVYAHMIFTPKFIYILTVGEDLKHKVRQNSSIIDSEYVAAINKAYEDAFTEAPDRDSQRFRDAWVRKLEQMGFVIDVLQGYDTPVSMCIGKLDMNTSALATRLSLSLTVGMLVLLLLSRMKKQ